MTYGHISISWVHDQDKEGHGITSFSGGLASSNARSAREGSASADRAESRPTETGAKKRAWSLAEGGEEEGIKSFSLCAFRSVQARGLIIIFMETITKTRR